MALVDAKNKSELMCTYAALILHDEKMEVNADQMAKLIAAAGGVIEPYWPKLFANLLAGKDLSALIANVGGSGGSGGAGGADGGDAGAEAEAEAEAEVEEEEEADMEGAFSLFD